MTIQRDPVHPYNLRNLAHGNMALGHELGGPFQFRPHEHRFLTPFAPSYPGGLLSCLHPFPYQVPLELGQGSKEREDGPVAEVVSMFSCREAPVLQARDQRYQLLEVAAEAGQPPHYQGVAYTDITQRLLQDGPCPRGGAGPHGGGPRGRGAQRRGGGRGCCGRKRQAG